LNPAKLGADGISQMKAEIDTMLFMGWQYILLKGRITRVDVTLDVAGISLEAMSICPHMPVKSTVYERSGVTGTIYLGSPKSPKQWRIYNKVAEQLEKDIQPKNSSIVRFERVIRTSMLLKNLMQLKNPFAELTVGTFPECPTNANWKHWAMFLDSCHQRGSNQALAMLLDPKTRTKYRKALKASKFDWWHPELLFWMWKKDLISSGLLVD
jgi:hypothetical protein